MSELVKNPFPSIPTPQSEIESLRRTCDALKRTVEMLTNQRGDPRLAAVLRKDLP